MKEKEIEELKARMDALEESINQIKETLDNALKVNKQNGNRYLKQ